jgi:hypothetical protein
MNFLGAGPLMLKYGIAPEQVDELKALAAKLPADFVDGTRMPIPGMPGLTAAESELLMARMLDAIAPLFDVPVDDPALLDELGLPTMRELMRTADQRKEGARRRRQGFRLGPVKPAKNVASVDELEINREPV